jgi:hypothetical protein
MSNRSDLLCSLLGKPWVANAKGPDAYDCWHLACAVSRAIWGRELPTVAVPANPSWAWMIGAIEHHPERQRWALVPNDAMGVIRAGDGALVLMARRDRPAHIGVWLAPERGVMHADPRFGVVLDTPVDLHTKGWVNLRFFQPG